MVRAYNAGVKLCRVALFGIFAFLVLPAVAAAATATRHVDVIRLQADVNPVSAQYLDRGIAAANSDGASAVVIELDTPGGDLGSLENMIQHMDGSRVPTIVFVYPEGAWAGSAGTFITVAGDIAAMSPGTTIGAASPVGSGGQTLGKTERAKVTNFATQYIATQAKDHGHSIGFAIQAVQTAKAIRYDVALSEHVINFVATSLPQLLREADGFTAKTANGPVTFHTAGAAIHYINMDWTERVLQVLIDPNLVLILLSVGTLAIIFELSSPGAILPGIVGVICISIALFSLGTIPVNAAGLLLMAFALLLFIADLKMPTHGFLTVGGVISFALGAVFLFSPSGSSTPPVSPWTVVFVTALMAGFFGFVVRKALKAQTWTVKTGTQALIGQPAVVRAKLNPEGTIYFDGAYWNAVTDQPPIEQGSEVVVTAIDGLTVHVVPMTAGAAVSLSPSTPPSGRDGGGWLHRRNRSEGGTSQPV
jgi:membrane-bound serine protease (ClpP class)